MEQTKLVTRKFGQYETNRCLLWKGRLEDFEEFLEFYHERPVRLDKVVTEIVLAGVDTGPRYLKQNKSLSNSNFYHSAPLKSLQMNK